MSVRFPFLVSSIILTLVTVSETQVYYWKIFNGTIPEDALIGAKHFGYNQYIGRGPVDAEVSPGLFVGAIMPGADSIRIPTEGNIFIVADYLEILCSNTPSSFTWVSTNSTEILSLSGLLKAGYYIRHLENLYVGRIKLGEQEYAIGHVNEHQNYNLYYLNGSVYSSTESDFETLTIQIDLTTS